MDALPELSTVADDEVVVHVPASEESEARVVRRTELSADADHEVEGILVHTLAAAPGERLATVATVNDLHFGEVECGVIEGLEMGPVLRSEPDEPPYPHTMNEAAVAEIAALAPDAVVAKGDLTTFGTRREFEQFLARYSPVFGDRLHYVRGNHDATAGEDFAEAATQEVALPGVTLAILDTTIPGAASGRLGWDQLDWLDELAARADRPVLAFGHHHPWDPGSRTRSDGYFGINPADSEALVGLVARRPAIVGYFAGHTHRNRVRRFAATGALPWVEVASVKDYPGSWAEYRVHEGGVAQIHRRISTPEALSWTEKTRSLFGGIYPQYAFGQVTDRCFWMPTRAG